MTRTIFRLSLPLFFLLAAVGLAGAHCEIPCGIYNDPLRADLIAEHTTTIEKSMKQIVALGKASPVDTHQLIRWVNNKEAHADKIQGIVAQYFLTQRINPDTENYAQKLAVLHRLLIAAMKCKQTTDLAHVQSLRTLLKEFEVLYFGSSQR